MTDKIFNFASSLLGHVRGYFAQVNVLSSMEFAEVSEATVTDRAGLGVIEIKAIAEICY